MLNLTEAERDGITGHCVTHLRQGGSTPVKALALRVLADRLEHGETIPELGEVFVAPA